MREPKSVFTDYRVCLKFGCGPYDYETRREDQRITAGREAAGGGEQQLNDQSRAWLATGRLRRRTVVRSI